MQRRYWKIMKRFALAAVESPSAARWRSVDDNEVITFQTCRRANERRFNLSIISRHRYRFYFPFSFSLSPSLRQQRLPIATAAGRARARANSPRRFNPLTKIVEHEQNEIVFSPLVDYILFLLFNRGFRYATTHVKTYLGKKKSSRCLLTRVHAVRTLNFR